MKQNATRGVSFLTLLAIAAGTFVAPAANAAQAGLNTTEKSATEWKLSDGVWSQSGTPGTTTVTFTSKSALVAGDVIILTFPQAEAPVSAAGTNATVNGVAATRVNDTVDNAVRLTLTAAVAQNAEVAIAMTDGLASYTRSTYAQQSVAINVNDAAKYPHNYGLALMTNDNTTDVTATVPLFLTMKVDDVTMDLGTLSVSSVKDVKQTYTVHSNNQTGVQVKVAADSTMRDQSGNTIDAVTDGAVTAGSEEYGFSVSAPTSNLVRNTPFDSGDDALPTTATNLVSSPVYVDNGTFDVTYKAAISGATRAGVYHQTVTTTIATNA